MAHIHRVYDTDTRFTVDPITRQAKNDGMKKVSIVRDDHDSEVFTFELPRYVEGHDMATCNRVEVHYLNTHSTTKETSTGIYVAPDFRVSETSEDLVVFSWTISCNATKFPGSLAFSLHYACVDDTTDALQYWWSSAINTSITVLDSINNKVTDPEGEEEEDSDLQDKTVTPTEELQVIRPDGEYRALAKVLVEAIPSEYVKPTGTLFVDANGEYEVRDYDKLMVDVPVPILETLVVDQNGEYTPDEGYAYDRVVVELGELQEKTLEITENDTYTIQPDEDYGALSAVKLDVKVEPNLQVKKVEFTENVPIVVQPDEGYDGLLQIVADVNVDLNLQEKTLEVTKNDTVKITPDEGYNGISQLSLSVNVPGVVSSPFFISGVTTVI